MKGHFHKAFCLLPFPAQLCKRSCKMHFLVVAVGLGGHKTKTSLCTQPEPRAWCLLSIYTALSCTTVPRPFYQGKIISPTLKPGLQRGLLGPALGSSSDILYSPCFSGLWEWVWGSGLWSGFPACFLTSVLCACVCVCLACLCMHLLICGFFVWV